ncbi:MAG TPA: histidine kinase dimerization/phosphoacceptor domain -containing protein [Acidisoma sp.]|uniref:histidine kinase dimerization/phosphoacceptor domain -containing protein n=1 Tax=Acidisoma sp. TaxID=1872115 RepID=UPI002CCAA90B|nr:histidine kinase dimerization/phosphoacceptor domain -containing protein [Acidisoma sp.]HTI03627.1 histidine kinase dimerization/phosphoacceptor domain -containing protein [Acidisoma sp.]
MGDTQGQAQAIADDRDGLVRELHHRVKNNLQIIVSLMNVQKRMLPLDRRGEIRFLEEHVQSMAAAYRVVYASGEMIKVSIDDLIREVVSGLVEVAGGRTHEVETAGCEARLMINLDQAITFGLTLAVALPPILDATHQAGGSASISTRQEADRVRLAIVGPVPIAPLFDPLRERLLEGHLKQLNAERISDVPQGELHISLPKPELV